MARQTASFRVLFGACTSPPSPSRRVVDNNEISLTVYSTLSTTILSPTSKGCLMNRKMMLVSTSVRLPPISQLKPEIMDLSTRLRGASQ